MLLCRGTSAPASPGKHEDLWILQLLFLGYLLIPFILFNHGGLYYNGFIYRDSGGLDSNMIIFIVKSWKRYTF